MDKQVASRIGIAAGLLLNSKWIATYARLGFDILTYKTVRSYHRECYPLPNWVRVRLDSGRLPDDPEAPLYSIEPTVTDDPNATYSVCFGMPSMAPDVWRADVERAKQALGVGQVLNVSVVGTPGEGGGLDELADDFARCGKWAVESGADFVEANFSCPNVCTAEGQIYHDPHASRVVAERIREAIGPDVPLLVKSGHFPSRDSLRAFLRSISGLVDAIVLVNGVQRRVLRADGTPVFGKYERVGILGRAIHEPSVANVREACAVIAEERLPLAVLGVGGVATLQDASDFLDAGADAVLLGSAPMTNPLFAIEYKQSFA